MENSKTNMSHSLGPAQTTNRNIPRKQNVTFREKQTDTNREPIEMSHFDKTSRHIKSAYAHIKIGAERKTPKSQKVKPRNPGSKTCKTDTRSMEKHRDPDQHTENLGAPKQRQATGIRPYQGQHAENAPRA